jgi:uncharacterized protein YcnI
MRFPLSHLFLLIGLGSVSWAHVTITPLEGRPDLWDVYVLSVPTEGDSPTIQVELVIPQSFEIEAIGHQKEWSFQADRTEKGLVRKILWQGGKIPTLTFDEFKFYAKNPKEQGSYWWTAYQKLENGQESTWSIQTFVRDSASGGSKTKDGDAETIRQAKTALTLSMVAVGVTVSIAIVVGIALWRTGNGDRKNNGEGA